MKWKSFKSRYAVLWAVIICYLLPFIALSTYSAVAAHNFKSLHLLSLGLLITSVGCLLMFWIIVRWQQALRSVPAPAPPLKQPIIKSSPSQSGVDLVEDFFPFSQESIEGKAELESLLEEMHNSNAQLQQKLEDLVEQSKSEKSLLEIEKERYQQQAEQAFQELDSLKQASYQQITQQKNLINDLQEVIAENKTAIEKKQQQISQLETKVSDMRYEIRTLLQLAEAYEDSDFEEPPPNYTESVSCNSLPPPPDFCYEDDVYTGGSEKQICTSSEASIQLRRCLDIAQKITGSNRFHGPLTSFLESPSDSFTIDLRRLCDSLRSENNCCILFYSPKESQLLFANNQIKPLTGWSPEKFAQNFFDLLQDSSKDWKQGIASLSMQSEAQVKLSLKAKNGQDVAVRGHLGLIATGIFRHHAIAVLYPAL